MEVNYSATEYNGQRVGYTVFAVGEWGEVQILNSGFNYPNGTNVQEMEIPKGTTALRLVADGDPVHSQSQSYGYSFYFIVG